MKKALITLLLILLGLPVWGQSPPAPGTVLVIDHFDRSPASVPLSFLRGNYLEEGHGRIVKETSQSMGGVAVDRPLPLAPGCREISREALKALDSPSLCPALGRKYLADFVESLDAGLLLGVKSDLDELRRLGVTGCVVNLSLGLDQAKLVDFLFDFLAQRPTALQNACRALGLDSQRLLGPDESVAAAERRKLMEALVEVVADCCSASPALREAQASYRQSVAALVERKNSVVVSAGNSGGAQEELRRRMGDGQPLRLPANFAHSQLCVPEVVAVGATTGCSTESPEQVEQYSSPDPEVDLYAPGQASSCLAQGTSFAAPRVAAALARLHRQSPGKTSAEVLAQLIDEDTHRLNSYGPHPQRPVLNHGASPTFYKRDDAGTSCKDG